MELIIKDNIINDEHSIPIRHDSKVFHEGLSCVQGPMETIYK